MPFVKQSRHKVCYTQRKHGSGLVNSVINKLPFELHLPGYQYCGPGTKLKKRLDRGDPGINSLDIACKQHDLAYDKNQDLAARHKADYELEQRAWEAVKSKNTNLKEKAAAWLVTNKMKTKRRLGMGCKSVKTIKKRNRKVKTKKVAFGAGIVSKIRKELQKPGSSPFVSNNGLQKTTQFALRAARKYLKASGGEKNIRTPRIIPIPKVGGILPLIPIFAGLSALSSLADGAAQIYRSINDVKAARQRLNDKNSHKNMQAVALGKSDKGLYLKPYRSGLGLYLKPYNPKTNKTYLEAL
ncbi:hypothetical protein NQ315_000641 [Exocentrus adspersus]|uniref:Phospholipase A2-like domain-containing protein n=1 Tax=Exocentrus adspersus TaxID=1586481 RepID=A0AAV8VMW4_9CUCU|nr:hypothetical protein NQ315_000641 [Exocentrus adspersus]